MNSAKQLRLFPDARPLVEKLGREFFLSAPECAGVYLMRDATEVVLYIGKARNLRKRLGSYRVANPDRMPRRHLRLLRNVERIELQTCEDERSALARESELLRSLRPKFNRAGTWPAPPRFFCWRCREEWLDLSVMEQPDRQWRQHGPMGRGAFALRDILARLVWIALHPHSGFAGLPNGWAEGKMEAETNFACGAMTELLAANLEKLLAGNGSEFCDWIRARLPPDLHHFDKTAVEAELEAIAGRV